MIEYNKAKDGRFYFNLKANNHETVQTSQMYPAKQSAESGADAVHKATGEYWALAFATIMEEEMQKAGEEDYEFSAADFKDHLLSLDNKGLQKIIDRIPYESTTKEEENV